MSDESSLLPLFPLNLVLYPGMTLPLHIFEERYKLLVNHCYTAEMPFGMVLAVETSVAPIGCMATIAEIERRFPDGRMDVRVVGTHRFRLLELNHTAAFVQTRYDVLPDVHEIPEALDDQADRVWLLYEQTFPFVEDPERILRTQEAWPYAVAAQLELDLAERERILEADSPGALLTQLETLMARDLPALQAAALAKKRIASNGHLHTPKSSEQTPKESN